MHPVDLELGCFSCSYFENMKAAPVPPGPSRFLEVPLGPSSWAAGLSSSNFRTQPRRLATRHRRGHMGHLGAGGPGAWVKLRAGRKAGEQQQVLQRRFHGRHAKNSDLLGPTTSNDESRVSNVSWYNVLICACVCVLYIQLSVPLIYMLHELHRNGTWNESQFQQFCASRMKEPWMVAKWPWTTWQRRDQKAVAAGSDIGAPTHTRLQKSAQNFDTKSWKDHYINCWMLTDRRTIVDSPSKASKFSRTDVACHNTTGFVKNRKPQPRETLLPGPLSTNKNMTFPGYLGYRSRKHAGTQQFVSK